MSDLEIIMLSACVHLFPWVLGAHMCTIYRNNKVLQKLDRLIKKAEAKGEEGWE